MKHTHQKAAESVIPQYPAVTAVPNTDIKEDRKVILSQDVTYPILLKDDKSAGLAGKPVLKTEYRIW